MTKIKDPAPSSSKTKSSVKSVFKFIFIVYLISTAASAASVACNLVFPDILTLPRGISTILEYFSVLFFVTNIGVFILFIVGALFKIVRWKKVSLSLAAVAFISLILAITITVNANTAHFTDCHGEAWYNICFDDIPCPAYEEYYRCREGTVSMPSDSIISYQKYNNEPFRIIGDTLYLKKGFYSEKEIWDDGSVHYRVYKR